MWRTGRPAAVLIFLSVTFVVLLYQGNLSNTAEKIRYIYSSYIIDLKNSYFVSDYEEWLHNQNELKSRIWRTCRKYKLAVTRKYQTHPRHFIRTAGSFVYCANHKVNHRNHRISLKQKFFLKGWIYDSAYDTGKTEAANRQTQVNNHLRINSIEFFILVSRYFRGPLFTFTFVRHPFER